MYIRRMSDSNKAVVLKEETSEMVVKKPMIRTQIYLRQSEYDYCQSEAKRRDVPMAAVIRSFISEKMEVPDEMWSDNPLLRLTPSIPNDKSPTDGSVNHDHYVYGCPKKWVKEDGAWVEAPPVGEGEFPKGEDRIVPWTPVEPKRPE